MFKQRLKESVMIRFMVCFVSLLVVKSGLLARQTGQTEKDLFRYEVQVKAQIVPIFAVDSKGNAVYDLKEEEITLYINRKPYEILQFINYQLEEEEEDVEKKKGKTKIEPVAPVTKDEEKVGEVRRKLKIKVPERINFIILDGISNSMSGVRNAKRLAMGIVKSGGPGDSFIILEASPSAGLRYVIGPEKNKTKLLQALEKIYQDPQWILLIPARTVGRLIGFEDPDIDFRMQLNRMSYYERRILNSQYRSELHRLSRSLQELKYALKTIRFPKTIFLVSGGIQQIVGDTKYYDQSSVNIVTYYETMKNAAVSINEGGSLLYLINPIPETHKIKKAVSIMSKISNAKCIHGSNVDDVLKQVKNNTAAYYELAFSIKPELGENFQIKIKCKRKGVNINTLRYGEKPRSYAEMEETQKKLFALNVALGGSWSRMVGKVQRVVCQTLNETTKKKIIIKKININIVKELQDRKLDIFVLNVDPVTLKADIDLFQRKVGEKETIEVEAQTGREQYIVIVEPEKNHCIFTQVS
jgi:hypothetical protein